ncbi:MAG: DUF1549 and DUF1553 domain-containing protein [Gemmatales bacterium]|nr:DUF1549 and DUF1553 domain-containing protein [Gemmatales bacterium]MDW8174255.1 DUF1549 and DUF1553 domain-containing protein [Gemmatales bacterium]
MVTIHQHYVSVSRPRGQSFRWVVSHLLMTVCSTSLLCWGQSPISQVPTGTPGWQVWPKQVILAGPLDGAQMQLLRYHRGAVQDWTRQAQWRSQPAGLVRLQATGWLEPLADGNGYIEVEAQDFAAKVPITVTGLSRPPQVSFRRQVSAALAVGGCNGGSCHGSPQGKNGFRLSLWGADARFDYFSLTQDLAGRRVNAVAPAESLVLRKALGRMPHEGGVRFSADSIPARMLHQWIASGTPWDHDLTTPPELRVEPEKARLDQACRTLQLVVHARFPGETWRDVTRLTVFQPNDPTLVRISADGIVEFRSSGEAAILCRYLGATRTVRVSYFPQRHDFVWKAPPENNAIDRLVMARLQELQILPSPLCSDSVFIRRVYLDLLGRLPNVEETRGFLASSDPYKREKLVDKLLADPQFAEFWSRKWMDVLLANQKRLPKDVLLGLHRWWQKHLHQGTPFDEMVRELLTAQGHTLENPPAAFFTIHSTAEDAAETTAQVFLGVRIGCARCHNHPFERWTQDDYYGLAACFARVERRNDLQFKPSGRRQPPVQIISSKKEGEVLHPVTGRPAAPRPLLSAAPFPSDQDRRVALAGWLTAPDNPFFARAVVNRLWFHLLGRGIADPPDDLRDTNPPSHEALLDFLARDFVEHGYNLRHTIRTICTSTTYQLSSEPLPQNADDTRFFSRAWPRLLTAEQLLDAIGQVTEVPETFPDFPETRRAVALPDSLPNHPFLSAFGQPPRELPCECERPSEPNLAQALQLVSGSTVHRKITAEKNRLGRLLAHSMSDQAILEELFLAAFSRRPTPRETQLVLDILARHAHKRAAWEDILWTLLNSAEFLYRP